MWWINRHRKARRSSRRRYGRRRNPGLGSLTSGLGSPFSLLPISFGSGLVGKIAGGIANSLAGGAVFATGFAASGFAVDMIVGTAQEAAADPSAWGKWKRPAAFAAMSGFIGAGVGWLASKLGLKNKGLLIALAAAGPGARAFGGAINALAPDSWKTDQGVLGSFVRNSGALADFLQLSDFMQLAGGGTGGQHALGEHESFGLGENESFGDPAGGDMDCGSGGDPMTDAGLDTEGLEAEEVGVF